MMRLAAIFFSMVLVDNYILVKFWVSVRSWAFPKNWIHR